MAWLLCLQHPPWHQDAMLDQQMPAQSVRAADWDMPASSESAWPQWLAQHSPVAGFFVVLCFQNVLDPRSKNLRCRASDSGPLLVV